MRNPIVQLVIDLLLYVFVYIILQLVCQAVGGYLFPSHTVHVVIATQLISSVATVVLFVAMRWSPFSIRFACQRPWAFYTAIVLFTVAWLLPSEYILEVSGVEMPDKLEALLSLVMANPLGWLAVGVFVPVCEEVLFRGAILGRLLNFTGGSRPWFAISVSALVFALFHGNLAQMPHAFAIGLLLGWLFWRTGSIVPGIVLHMVNNSSAVAFMSLCVDSIDDHLVDVFHGNNDLLATVLVLCVVAAVASLWWLVSETPHNSRRESNDE